MSRTPSSAAVHPLRLLLLAGLIPLASASAQNCTPGFSSGFEFPGVYGPGGGVASIYDSIMYDAQDGNGPRLHISGRFDRAGGRQCFSVARFDGANFVPLGAGIYSSNQPASPGGHVYKLEVFDPDGTGAMTPELWACGTFTRARQSNGVFVAGVGIARWRGSTSTWEDVGVAIGYNQAFNLLADVHVSPVPGFEDGPRLYVAHREQLDGSFVSYLRWDGVQFTETRLQPAFGTAPFDNVALDFAKYNGRVYIGGAFREIVARVSEDGTTYESLPAAPIMTGVGQPPGFIGLGITKSMVVWNNRLLIGSDTGSAFGMHGPFSPVRPESWDGTSWQAEAFGPLGSTAFSAMGALTVADLGSGPRLFIGDDSINGFGFNTSSFGQGQLPANYNGGAMFNGATLATLGAGPLGTNGDRAPIDGGSEPGSTVVNISTFTKCTLRGQQVVFAGGDLGGAEQTNGQRVRGQGGTFFNGTDWVSQYQSDPQGGFAGNAIVKLDGVNDSIVVNGSNTTVLFDAANRGGIAFFNGQEWRNSTIPNPSRVWAPSFVRYNSGTGDALFAVGQEVEADRPNDRPAKIQVQKWNPTSSTWEYVSSLANLPGSTGPGLPAGAPTSTLSFDTDGSGPLPAWLIVAGNVSADEFISTPPSIVAYDGTTWRPLGVNVPTSTSANLVIFNDGSGPKLFATGAFSGGTVARYDGTGDSGTWTVIGQNGSGRLRVIDLGSGPQLFLCGSFNDVYTSAPNATPTGPIARWDGTSWSGVNASPIARIHPTITGTPTVNDIAAFDDGSGVALYAVGSFGALGGVPAQGIAKRTGTTWAPIGTGFNSFTIAGVPDNRRMSPTSLVVFDDDGSGPTRPALYVGGIFDNANGVFSQNFARYGCPRVVCRADFDWSGSVTVTDIFEFLNAWFAGNPAADFDGMNGVDVADIFALLNAWFAGC